MLTQLVRKVRASQPKMQQMGFWSRTPWRQPKDVAKVLWLLR